MLFELDKIKLKSLLEHVTLGGLKATDFGFVAWLLNQIKIYDHEMDVIGLRYLKSYDCKGLKSTMEQYKVHPRIVKNDRCICIMILWRLTKVMNLQFNMNLILDKKNENIFVLRCMRKWNSCKANSKISRWCYYKLKNNKCSYLQLSFTRCTFIVFFIVKILTKTSCFCCWFA